MKWPDSRYPTLVTASLETSNLASFYGDEDDA